MNMFRTLNADEIDCRIAQIKKTQNGAGLSLLLYKDARCDQNILDETVGPMNWKREHTRDNANCIVSIWDDGKKQWISKEDTGTESNTEKEKGLASDSFKRSCFNWGIGRELYTAPFIWISEKDCNIKEINGSLKCFDRFTVNGISYKDGVIVWLRIKNQNTGKICYSFGNAPDSEEKPPVEMKQDAPAVVTTSTALPQQPKKEAAKADVTPVQVFLLTAMKGLREARGITVAQNNKLFKEQREALVKGKLAPDKPLEEYTMEEAEALIDAMYKTFSPEGTEIKQ